MQSEKIILYFSNKNLQSTELLVTIANNIATMPLIYQAHFGGFCVYRHAL